MAEENKMDDVTAQVLANVAKAFNLPEPAPVVPTFNPLADLAAKAATPPPSLPELPGFGTPATPPAQVEQASPQTVAQPDGVPGIVATMLQEQDRIAAKPAKPAPLAQPATAEAKPESETVVFGRGHAGDDVKRVQEKLKEDGFDIKADGIFGAATETALKAYQKKHGLAVDGVVGKEVLNAMGLAGETASPAVTAPASRETSPQSSTVASGNTTSNSLVNEASKNLAGLNAMIETTRSNAVVSSFLNPPSLPEGISLAPADGIQSPTNTPQVSTLAKGGKLSP